MAIFNNKKGYQVQELKSCWKITQKSGNLTIVVKVDKDLCRTETELTEYLKAKNII